jgi:hypothetical protein
VTNPDVLENDATHVLPAFDEFLISYSHRDHVLAPAHVKRVNAGGGLLAPILVDRGLVIGTWSRVLGKTSVEVTTAYFAAATRRLRADLRAAFVRYATFLDRTLEFDEG